MLDIKNIWIVHINKYDEVECLTTVDFYYFRNTE